MTAARAFGFCLTYKRTTEFRRLCDILRNHLANLNKCVRLPLIHPLDSDHQSFIRSAKSGNGCGLV